MDYGEALLGCRGWRPDEYCRRDCQTFSGGNSDSYRDWYQYYGEWASDYSFITSVLNDGIRVLDENQDLVMWAVCLASRLFLSEDMSGCVYHAIWGRMLYFKTDAYIGNQAAIDAQGEMATRLGEAETLVNVTHSSWTVWYRNLDRDSERRFSDAVVVAQKILHEMLHRCGLGDRRGHGVQMGNSDIFCAGIEQCGGVIRAVDNTFRWAMCKRYPCLTDQFAHRNFGDDRLWLWSAAAGELPPEGVVPESWVVCGDTP